MNSHLPTDIDTEVLVVGAGPTGLTMAIELRRRGIDCRLIERDDSSVETSRALAIQPRTLQVFEDMGIIDEILDEGMRINGATVYYRQRELSRLDMDNLGSTPYPFLWWLPQNRTERILVDRLQELDGAVEFERELIDFEQADDAVRATVVDAAGGGDETASITANWLIGCDGAHSQVRDTLGRTLQGETLEQEMLVADVIADWQRPANEGALWLHEEGILAALPMLGENEWRLFVDVSPTPPDERPEATRDVLQRLVRQRTNDDVTIHDAPWTSNFVTNQRMVSGYRSGRVFLAGDAAHVHSPLVSIGLTPPQSGSAV